MRDLIIRGKRRKIQTEKYARLSVLTLDDLDKTNWKHNQLIAQLQARYQANREPCKDKPNQKADDSAI